MGKKYKKRIKKPIIEKEIPEKIVFSHFPCDCGKREYTMETKTAKSWCNNCKKIRHEGIENGEESK